MSDPAAIHDAIANEIDRVLIGNDDVVEGLSISLLTGGHLLLEGVPGVAKTTLANLFARASGLDYGRIQMTPDILPADITGTHIYREPTGEFELLKGPVFTNMLLADEINRATPKTQSALLEAMQEGHATIEGETLSLPDPFMVVATMNPLEMEGVYALPEAQRDRFQFKYVVGLPDRTDERELIDRFDDTPDLGPDDVSAVVTTETIRKARETADDVFVADPIKEYVLDIARSTRESPALEHGGSPRSVLAFLHGAKARAAIHGREYIIPDDIKALAKPVLRHRVIRSTDAELNDRSVVDIIEELLDSTAVPSGSFSMPAEASAEE